MNFQQSLIPQRHRGLHTKMSQARYAIFDNIKFDLLKGILINHAGEEMHIEPKIQAFLTLLVESNGEVLEKNTLLSSLWDDPEKADERLRALVKKTREALGDSARSPKYIKTIPKRGYLFLADVVFESESTPSTPSPATKWVGIIAGCFAVLSVIVYFMGSQPQKETEVSAAWTIVEEQTQQIDHGWRAYQIADNALFTLSHSDEIIDVAWFAEQQFDMRIQLNDKQLLFEGLSVDKQQAYIITSKDMVITQPEIVIDLESISEQNSTTTQGSVTKQQRVAELTYWSLDNDTYSTLNTITLPDVPSHVLAFDSANGQLYLGIETASHYQIVKVNIEAPGPGEVLVDKLSDELSGLYINKTLDKALIYHNDFVSSSLLMVDLATGEQQTKLLHFPIVKIVDSDVHESVLLLDRDERIFGFNFDTQELTLWQTRLQLGDELIGACGYNCILVHRAASAFDVYTHPLLDLNNDRLTTVTHLGTSPAISSMIAADNHVFVSTYRTNGIDITNMSDNPPLLSASLDSLQSTSQLIKSPTSGLLAGAEADRIFIVDPATNDFRWLDIPMSKIGFPQFDLYDENVLYFTSLDPRFDTSVFKYSLTDDTYEKIATDVVLHMPLSESLQLTLSTDGEIAINEGENVILSRQLERYGDLRVYPNEVAFLAQETVDIFDISSKRTKQFQQPSLFNTGVFDIDVLNDVFAFASANSKQSSIVKMTQVEKSY